MARNHQFLMTSGTDDFIARSSIYSLITYNVFCIKYQLIVGNKEY
jgi:hypothetical protein